MKDVKIIFISMEIAAIVGVLFLSFSTTAETSMGHWFHAAYITLLAMLAVVMQSKQQEIDWDEEID